MSDDRFEEDLRLQFRALRDRVADVTPSFTVPVLPHGPRRTWPAWAAAAAVVTLAVSAWWLLRDPDTSNQYGIDLTTTMWTGPTDFLLETPGNELLRQMPVFGADPYPSQAATQELDSIDSANRSGRNRS